MTRVHRRRSARCLRLSLLVVLFLTTGFGQEPAFTQSDFWFADELQPYRGLVDAHRAGRAREAIQGVLALDPEVIHALIDRVRDPDARLTGTDAEPALNELLFRAAAMLQLDVADSLWSRGLEEAASDWIEVAVRWIELGARDPEPEQSFRRRWYLAVTLLAFERGGWSDGVTFSEVALERVPDDVPLLIAAAWLNEGRSFWTTRVGPSFPSFRRGSGRRCAPPLAAPGPRWLSLPARRKPRCDSRASACCWRRESQCGSC